MCITSKTMEKCSSSTWNLVGSACSSGAVESRVAARVAVANLVFMIVSPLVEPADIQRKRPTQKGQCHDQCGASKPGGGKGKYGDHQRNNLPYAYCFAPETVRQRLVEPRQEMAGGQKAITHHGKHQYPWPGFADSHRGNA